jgi:hypothetical protein
LSAQLSIGPLALYGRQGKFTWRMCATVLAAQSILVFFGALVARAIASAENSPAATAYLAVGSALALGCVLGAGAMRSRIGVTFGWLIQLATFAAALVVPLMAGVGLIFTALWVLCLVQGRRIDAGVPQ